MATEEQSGRLSYGGGSTVSKFGHDFDYTGLHAFVFIDHVDPGVKAASVVDGLFGLDGGNGRRVLWASTFVGDYLAFAHVQVDDKDERNDLASLQEFIENDLWDNGVHCSWSTEVVRPDRVGIKRDTPEVIALVGIKTHKGQAFHVADVLEGDADHPGVNGFKGASVVLGQLDVILQLGGETFEEVVNHVVGLQSFEGLDGIVSTSTAITDGRRGSFS
jgi:hypothetical protein